MNETIDLGSYWDRLGCEPPPAPDLATLESLHLAHAAAIPFCNLEVRLRKPVPLDLPSLQERLVDRRRGGYCFEQNTLFAGVLRELGFRVETLEARVRPPDAPAPLPRTHMLLRVELPEGTYLADVGFGGDGPLAPVPFDGTVSEQPGDSFRIVREGSGPFVLQRLAAGVWTGLYAFLPTPALPADYQVAHHYTSTHPRSPFVNTLTVQRSTPEARRYLRGRSYIVRRGEAVETREVEAGEAAELLRTVFGLAVEDEEVRRALPQ